MDGLESGGGGAFARGSPGQHEGPPGEERLPDHLGKAHTDSNNERRSAYPHGKEPEDPHTGCGSLQVKSAVSHGHIATVPDRGRRGHWPSGDTT